MQINSRKAKTDSVQVVKSHSVDSSFKQLSLVEVNPKAPGELIEAYFLPINDNAFTALLPLRNNPTARNSENLDYNGSVQPLVFEFDEGGITFQEKRIEVVKEHFDTPQFIVYSGNKSIHHYFWFKHFADNKVQYMDVWSRFYKYLSIKFPNYFTYSETTPPGNKDSLVADTRMKTPSMYCRQANGKRENGVLQKGEYYNKLGEGVESQNILQYIDSISLDSLRSTKFTRSPNVTRTRSFLTNGVDEGSRDEACFKAACALRDCGYSKKDALALLNKGADLCTPPFPHDEVLVKLKSAYDKYSVLPFAFIEPITSAYYYQYNGKLFQATKDILKESFKSRGAELPNQYPVLEFKFDVHDNHQVDLTNGTYNLFKPTKYQLMPKTDEAINPIVSFPNIYKLLSNLIPRNKEKKYFLNWLAAILQTRQKMMMSFVFIGRQGAGKGVFLGHILKPLFGELQTIQVEDEQLKSSFNGWIKNAFFIAFNEVAHDNRGRNSLNSKIKSIITDPTITVNEKNIRTYQIQNNVNCVFFSNERVPLLIEHSDRRFTIVETGGNLANQEWFKVPKSFNDIQNELKAFAQFLWNKDFNFKEANTPLSTDLKNVLITAAQNRWEEFSHRLKNADEEWFKNQLPLHNLWAPDWSDMKEKKRIEKSKALDIFKGIYEMQDISQTVFTKQMALYGIRAIRQGTGIERKHYYEWN